MVVVRTRWLVLIKCLVVITIGFISAAFNAEEEYYCGQAEYKKCIDELREKKPASDTCRKLRDYEAKHPFHWQEERHFEQEEWKIRQELKTLGLELPYEVAPIDYAKYRGASGHEVIAIFQPIAFEDEKEVGSRFSLITFKIDPENHPCKEPATFPIATVTLFGRKNSQSPWTQLGTPIDADSPDHEGGISLHKQLDESVKPECPKTPRIFKDGVAICFTQLVERDWPEVHVWNDYLASTGVTRDSYLWNGKSWSAWIERSDDVLKIIDKQALLIRPLLASQDTWTTAQGGVDTIDTKTGAFIPSPQWTRQILKPYKVTSLPEATSFTKPGFYCKGMSAPFNGHYNYCLELVEKNKSTKQEITIQEPKGAEIHALLGYDYLQFPLSEKQHIASAVAEGLKNEVTSVSKYTIPNQYNYMPHFEKIVVTFDKAQTISFAKKNVSLKSMVIPIFLSQQPNAFEKKLDLKVGYIYSNEPDSVAIQLKPEFFDRLFCSHGFRINDYYPGSYKCPGA